MVQRCVCCLAQVLIVHFLACVGGSGIHDDNASALLVAIVMVIISITANTITVPVEPT